MAQHLFFQLAVVVIALCKVVEAVAGGLCGLGVRFFLLSAALLFFCADLIKPFHIIERGNAVFVPLAQNLVCVLKAWLVDLTDRAVAGLDDDIEGEISFVEPA